MKNLRRSLARHLLVWAALAAAATHASAQQTTNGSFPRSTSPGTWQRPDGGCSTVNPVNPTTRTFALVPVELTGAGNYTVSVTRTGGGFVALNLYQGAFYGTTGTDVCVNWTDQRTQGSGSVSLGFSCGGPFCNSTYYYYAVVSGANGSDNGQFTLTVSGGPPVRGLCSTDGTLSPTTQVAAEVGASYSTTYTPANQPASDPACKLWTTSNVPAWISGVPSGSSGTQTINYTVARNTTGSARSATINIGTETLTVTQPAAAPCTYSLGASGQSFGSSAGSGSISLTAGTNCPWTASTAASWIHLGSGSGSGSGTIGFSVDANTGPARSATITVQGLTYTVSQSSGCTVSFASSMSSAGVGASSPSIMLNTGAGCAWTLTSTGGFLSGFPTSGTGSSNVNYNVAANTGPVRSGSLQASIPLTGSMATHTVQQANGCSASVSPSSVTDATGLGGSTSIALTLSNSACTWTASASGWLGITPASGSGSATLSLTYAANTGAARMGTVTIAGQAVTVAQASSCTISVSTAAAVGASAGSSTFNVTAPAGCAWTVAESLPWVTASASSSGSGTVSYSYFANVGPMRTGAIRATLASTGAFADFGLSQASGCTASLGSSSASPGATGATNASVTLTLSDSACPWTASSNAAWLTPTVSSGTGSRSFTYDVAANTGPSRVGTLTIAGQAFTVTQASGCRVMLDPASSTAPAAGGMLSFAVQTSAGCAWTAATSSSFISAVTASGTGTGNVQGTVAANVGPMRMDSIRVTATDTAQFADYTLSQLSGCTASLASPSVSPAASGGTASVELTMSSPACAWTADSSESFVTLTEDSGTGSTTFEYTVAANTGPARSAFLTIAGQRFDIDQASGCTVSVAADQSVPSSSGSGSLQVTTAPGCGWTASTSAAWLSDVTGSGTGSGTVDFDYAANLGSTRNATIHVASTSTASSADHSVQQADGCVAMLSEASAMLAAGGGSGNVDLVMSAPDCVWNASAGEAWLSVSPSSGSGSTAIGFMVEANVSLARMGSLQIAGQTFLVSQSSGCAVALTPSTAQVPAAAGSHSFDLAIDSACSWTASETLDWVSGVTGSGTGPATITWASDENVGPVRSGNITFVATESGQSVDFALEQDSGCTATLGESSMMVGKDATSESVSVSLSSPACVWTASTGDAFISLGSGGGTGDGDLGFSIAANAGPVRMGQIQIADRTLMVTQADGCAVALSPASRQVSIASGTTQFDVATAAACEWTAAGDSPWLSDITASGTGPGQVELDYAANSDVARTGHVTVSTSSGASQQFTLSQADGCTISLPVDEAGVTASGGMSSFAVVTGDSCVYSVRSDATWVTPHITATGVEYTVAAWNGAVRSAHLTVVSETSASSAEFTLTQAAGCTLMLMPGDVGVSAEATTVAFEVETGQGCVIRATSASDFVSNVTVDGSTVTAAVAENLGAARVGMLEVSAGDATGTFVVQQDAAETGAADGGVPDGGLPDGGSPDGGSADAGPVADGGSLDGYVIGGGCGVATGEAGSVQSLMPLLLLGLAWSWRRLRCRDAQRRTRGNE